MEIIFLLVGLLFAFIGIYLIWDHLRFLSTGRVVEGRVIALEKRTTPAGKSRKQGGPIYYPVIEYRARGQSMEFTSGYGRSTPSYEIGKKLPVIYSKKMNQARIKQKAPFVFGSIFAAVGIGLCVIFFYIFNFNLWSAGLSLLVLTGALNSVRKKLAQHDISTIDEFKEALRNTDMKTGKGTKPERAERITSNNELHLDELKRTKSLKYAGPALLFIGAAAIAGAIYLGIERADFLETAVSAEGKVVDFNRKRSDNNYVYYPIVEFTYPGSSDAVTITFEHQSGSNPPSYFKGEQVRVLYNPDNPQNAIIDAGIMNWLGPGLAAIFGIIFFSSGVSSMVYRFRLKKQGRNRLSSPY